MITIYLGNIGSGKTLHAVRNMYLSQNSIPTYANIKTRKIKNVITIQPDMIIQKNIVRTIKRKDGTIEPVYKFQLNKEFWRKLSDVPLNVTIDEAHTLFNSRRSHSKINVLFSEWVSLLRRILGSRQGRYGNLVLITQLERRIDVIAREMATHVIYHTCYWIKRCKKCGFGIVEHSDMPEHMETCSRCAYPYLATENHQIDIKHFRNMEYFSYWKDNPESRTFFKHYILKNVNKYFPMYNTLQWDNLFSEYY